MLGSVSGAFRAGVDVDTHSFTAGADYRVFAVTMTGFTGSGSADTLRDIISAGGKTTLEAEDEDGAIGSTPNIAGTVLAAIGENDTFAIGVGAGDTIVAVVDADPECVAPEWNVIAGIGVFTGSFVIKL